MDRDGDDQALTAFFDILIGGVFHAAVLFLVAAGLQLVFGVQKIVNLACGSFYALGAYFGISAVKWALGSAPSPFFRFPALQHPPAIVTYLGERNIAIWSCDLDSFDFKASKAEKIVDTVMTKLDKNGKGIVLMHDFQKHTAEALPELMKRLKAGGYKIVQVKAKAPVQTIAQYDEEVTKSVKLPTVSTRPLNSVVQTISE